MRKDFGAKTWLYPMPVQILAAYGEDGSPMAMNVGWAGILGHETLVIGLGRHHRTTECVLHSGAFTLSQATRSTLIPCDYVGIDSGNQVSDKIERTGFHFEPCESCRAPRILELPVTLECQVLEYDEEKEILIGRILNLSADSSVLDEKGRIDPEKGEFLTLDPGTLRYRTLGPAVGRAFRDGLSLSDKGSFRPFEDEPKP